jgi:acyl-CoA synthetase (AMP-forming)/AMP-acid ligase II
VAGTFPVVDETLEDATSFWELLIRRVTATPDAPMLLDEHDRRVTFAEAAAWAERVAAGFHGLGIRSGTAVAWQLPTRIETVIASLALCRLDALQVPIIHLYREREVAFVLRESRVALYLVPGEWKGFDYRAMGEAIAVELPHEMQTLVAYDSLPEGDPAVLPAPANASADDAPVRWTYYTSGTTANPKGARHTDGTLIAAGVGLARAIDLGADDVCTVAFPYAHIGGPDLLVTMLLHGVAGVFLESFVPAEAVSVLNRHGATVAGGSTAFYQAFLNEQRAHPDGKVLPSLRLLSGGGAPKPPELFFEVQREMGVPVCHGYGMTEVPMIAQGSPRDTDEQLAYSDGAPIYGAEVRIVDGEIRVRGPMVCKGYTDPALDADAFDDDGFFRTGDLGELREDGHVVLTGRLKDVIIRKGENISAKEIEDVLYQHPKVAAVAVIGLPDRERGERVCAVVERSPEQEPLTFDELREHCLAAGLMKQKVPEQLEVVDALPRNPTMKILKYVLRDQYGGAH